MASSDDSGVAIAASKDGFKQIFCQGHPEYDTVSLLKEYKREISRFINNEVTKYPPLPANYLDSSAKDILEDFKSNILKGKFNINDFPEDEIIKMLDNTWRDTAKSIFSNWLGLVYRVTHVKRKKQFMDGVDPNFPISKWYK